MKLKHNKRLLNALNANQLSAKWKVATENAEDGVASKTMEMPWPEIHAAEVSGKRKKKLCSTRGVGGGVVRRGSTTMLPMPLGDVSHPQDVPPAFSPNNVGQMLLKIEDFSPDILPFRSLFSYAFGIPLKYSSDEVFNIYLP